MKHEWRIGLLVAALALGGGALAQGGGYPQGGSGQQQGGQQQGGQQQQDEQPLGGSGQQGMPQGGSGQQQAGQQPRGQQQMQANPLVAQDRGQILAQLQQINQWEIDTGQLATQKGQSQRVKEFGQRMVQEHTNAMQQVRSFAQQQNIELTEFTPNNEVQRAAATIQQTTRELLQGIQGRPFDQQYLASQVAGHDSAISVVQQGLQQFPELKPVLTQLMPVLQKHRQQAYNLLGEVGQQRQAREPPPGR